MGRRQGATREHILNRYVTEEQRRRRPIFIATLRAARLLAGCFVAHRSKTTAGILPLRFAHPAKIRGGAAIPVTDLVHWYSSKSIEKERLLRASRRSDETFRRKTKWLANIELQSSAYERVSRGDIRLIKIGKPI